MRPAYTPIKPKERLYQEIVDQIQQRIVAGALKPGDQIPAERELAEQFGVSRTAVREAIKSLTEKGLIEVYVGRGTFVTELDPTHVVESLALLLRRERDSIRSLHEARAILEIPVVKLAARYRTEEHLARLHAITRDLEQDDASPTMLVDADTEFHLELARATGNAVLLILSQTIMTLLRTERVALGEQVDEIPTALASHRRIVQAVSASDEADAAAAMAEHLQHVASTSAHPRGTVPAQRLMLETSVAAD
jgi:GntR family transcriptional repressor for pyruvate dehydrogenase complex